MEKKVLIIKVKRKIKFDTILNSFFESSFSHEKEYISCSRVIEIPSFLKELFERETYNLKDESKKCFAQFLIEFQDVFSKEIVARNCKEVKHKIVLTDSKPIKQVPHRVSFHYREEVDKLIENTRVG